MHAYRTHTCGALRASDSGQTVRLSGWVHSMRSHGGLVFIDLRDHYGITQCVFDKSAISAVVFATITDELREEMVITVTGQVRLRSPETVNPRIPSGGIEVHVTGGMRDT